MLHDNMLLNRACRCVLFLLPCMTPLIHVCMLGILWELCEVLNQLLIVTLFDDLTSPIMILHLHVGVTSKISWFLLIFLTADHDWQLLIVCMWFIGHTWHARKKAVVFWKIDIEDKHKCFSWISWQPYTLQQNSLYHSVQLKIVSLLIWIV